MTPGFVYLNEDSPFYAAFPQGKAPVKDTKTSAVSLMGSPETEAYMLDIGQLTPAQLDQIAQICTATIGGAAQAVKQQMATIGLPIRKSMTSGIAL